MSLRPVKHRLLDLMQANPSLASRGIKAELVGRYSIKVSRDGRYLGIWREMLGSFEWYPAGATCAQHHALTPDEAAGHLNQILGGNR